MKRSQSFPNGRGVVGEVFDDGDAADLRTDFKAALDALEAFECFDDGFF